MLFAPARGQLVQGLDCDREANRGIDISLGNLETGAVGDQRHADQQQETQRQHFHGWVAFNEIGEGLRCR